MNRNDSNNWNKNKTKSFRKNKRGKPNWG